MGRVRVLDERTVNHISAGEVVERPASVVKELVENSLDAGARHVEISFREAGLAEIRVTDDGCGMAPDDAILAFERHATSKITSLEDLQTLDSLGFRGEALPSIAAVSRLRLLTKAAVGDEPGFEVRLDGGRLAGSTPVGAPPGTTVVVQDLFYNTPVRLKFLKSASTETTHIVDTVARLAVARPDVSFRLRREGNLIYGTAGRGDLYEVLLAVWNMSPADFVPVGGSGEGGREKTGFPAGVGGLLARPDRARGNRQYQYLALNGRPIESRLVGRAVEEALAGLLPKGRYPLYALSLRLNPADFDVNVHPAKREVRFSREQDLFRMVFHAVKAAVGAEPRSASGMAGMVYPVMSPHEAGAPVSAQAGTPGAWRIAEGGAPVGGGAGAGTQAGNVIDAGLSLFGQEDTSRLADLKPLGQLAGQFIVAAGPDGLYLVDQHAAHERVVYEQLAPVPAAAARDGQPLLTPMTVNLSPREAAVLEGMMAELAAMGLTIEPFGRRGSFAVREVPRPLASAFTQASVGELIDSLEREVPGPLEAGAVPAGVAPGSTKPDDSARAAMPGQERREAVRRSLAACHGSVRANQNLSFEEMSALLARLSQCNQPFTCPHGRPTVVRFPLSELRRRFGRRGQ